MNEYKIRCSTENCNGSIQATCEECKNFHCFSCSLKHSQKMPNHNISQFQASISNIKQKCDDMMRKLKIYQAEAKVKVERDQKNNKQKDARLNPQKFQEQLNYVTAMEKETIKIVEKFFSELSLELVNIWETYLNKFSNPENSLDHISQLIAKLDKIKDGKPVQKADFIANYYEQNFQDQAEQCRRMAVEADQNTQVPLCPDIVVSEQMLIQISQMLCSEISTRNYQFPRIKNSLEERIHISVKETLDKNVKFMPIFPIRKQYCYLYNLNENTYEIQEFDKLDFLPAFPKTIMLWNGDIHLIGGANVKDQVISSHVVFRSATAEVFKLGNLPLPRNPTNALLSYKKTIYLIGGLNEKKEWDEHCYEYHLEKKEWVEIAPMKSPKAHQTASCFNDKIYCFGIPSTSKVNIQEYDIANNRWKDIHLSNFLGNPFNFAASFSAIQINESEILLFGGKKYLENIKNQKRSTDRIVTPNIYVYQPLNSSFFQIGALNPCIGVRDGEITPIIRNGKIYSAEYLVSRNQPICRWLSALHILQISSSGKCQSVIIFHQD